jgi:hypothetical protein
MENYISDPYLLDWLKVSFPELVIEMKGLAGEKEHLNISGVSDSCNLRVDGCGISIKGGISKYMLTSTDIVMISKLVRISHRPMLVMANIDASYLDMSQIKEVKEVCLANVLNTNFATIDCKFIEMTTIVIPVDTSFHDNVKEIVFITCKLPDSADFVVELLNRMDSFLCIK